METSHATVPDSRAATTGTLTLLAALTLAGGAFGAQSAARDSTPFGSLEPSLAVNPSSMPPSLEAPNNLGVGRKRDAYLPMEAQRLLATTPGLKLVAVDDHPVAFYGTGTALAATPAGAASRWWVENTAAFGVDQLVVHEVRQVDLGYGEFTVFSYEQRLHGIPVENTAVRMLVRNDSRGSLVNLVSAQLAPTDVPERQAVEEESVGQILEQTHEAQALEEWTETRQVYLYDSSDPQFKRPVFCLKTQG